MAKYGCCARCNKLYTVGLNSVKLFRGLSAVFHVFFHSFFGPGLLKASTPCILLNEVLNLKKNVLAKQLIEIQSCAGLASPVIKILKKILSDSKVGKCL